MNPTPIDEQLKLALEEKRRSSAYRLHLQGQRQRLPACRHAAEIVDTVENHQVVVISGETGCGKTTQVPQLILEAEIRAGRGSHCSIICTQPRRISAIGVAERVADEMCESPVGSGLVGYQIRLERRANDGTRLLYCTNGILLRRLQVCHTTFVWKKRNNCCVQDHFD